MPMLIPCDRDPISTLCFVTVLQNRNITQTTGNLKVGEIMLAIPAQLWVSPDHVQPYHGTQRLAIIAHPGPLLCVFLFPPLGREALIEFEFSELEMKTLL